MPAPRNLIGLRFGRLVVVRQVEHYVSPKGFRLRRFLAKCDCGEETIVNGNSITTGRIKSCGCLWRSNIESGNVNRIHSHARPGRITPEYRAWQQMIARCTNPRKERYKNYGGRGIKVCKAWNNSFQTFLDHIGPRPSPKHSLDRINPDGHYEPGNVRWATQDQQYNNRTDNRYVIYRGNRLSLTHAVRAAGNIVGYGTAKARIAKLRWSAERAIETPPLHVGGRKKRF